MRRTDGRERRGKAHRQRRRLTAIPIVATAASLAALALAATVSAAAAGEPASVARPWVTSSQPAATGWSVNVLDTATFPSSLGLAAAQLHVWGQPPPPPALVFDVDGLFSADFPVSGLPPGRGLASVAWTPLQLFGPTSWSSPVAFGVGEPSCPQPAVPVSLPGIDVSYSTHTTKPWGVRYLPLGLTFTPTSPATSSTCSLQATGTLDVQIGLRLVQGAPQITIPVDSVATAELDFLRPGAAAAIPTCDWVAVRLDCSLDGLSGNVLRWHTEGFSEQIQTSPGHWVQVFNSGPLTFYDSVDPSLSFAQQVQAAETAFHVGLISHLQDINPFYVIQEPPAHLSVTDAAGRLAGMAPDGRIVQGIPGSVSVIGPAGYSAVVLLTPRGTYTVTASGPPRGGYSLTMDALQRGGRSDLVEATAGRFARAGRTSVCLPTGGARCSAVLIRLPAFAERPRRRVIALPWG